MKKKTNGAFVWLATDGDGREYIYSAKPSPHLICKKWVLRNPQGRESNNHLTCCILPKGTIQSIIGQQHSWGQEPIRMRTDSDIYRNLAEKINWQY